jgi:hypothetical protein
MVGAEVRGPLVVGCGVINRVNTLLGYYIGIYIVLTSYVNKHTIRIKQLHCTRA